MSKGLLLFLVAGVVTQAQEHCLERQIYHQIGDYLLEDIPEVYSWQECQTLCLDNDLCKVWNFRTADHPNLPSSCVLGSNYVGTVAFSPHVTCGSAPCGDCSGPQRFAMDGCSTNGPSVSPTCLAADGGVAGIRCCAADGESCSSYCPQDNQWYQPGSPEPSATFVGFDEASEFCSAQGQRLCSSDEIDVCCNTGCAGNDHHVWAMDTSGACAPAEPTPAPTTPSSVTFRSTITRIADYFLPCSCTGTQTRFVNSSSLPYSHTLCSRTLELESFNSATGQLNADGYGGSGSANMYRENYNYHDGGATGFFTYCLLIQHVSIDGQEPFGYDEDVAYHMISLSDLAYESEATINSAVAADGFSQVTHFESNTSGLLISAANAYSAVHLGRNEINLAFRGSDNTAEILQQVSEGAILDPSNLPNSFCNGCNANIIGFHRDASIKLMNDGVRAEMASLRSQYPDFAVRITGHSLGGALANLVALRLRLEGIIDANTEVYTIGAPRVGNRPFASAYENWLPNTYRIVYNRDVVPHLPPCNPVGCETGTGWAYHAGHEIWYIGAENSGGAMCGHVVCESGQEQATESRDCSRALVDHRSTNDHSAYWNVLAGERGFCGNGAP